MKNEPIVYCRNYFKGRVIVTRTASGKWQYEYNIYDVFDIGNEIRRERGETKRWNVNSNIDAWNLSKRFSNEMETNLDECKLSYGDKI